VETLLRKYLWAVDLVVIALCATFAARAAATVIEKSLVSGAATSKRTVRAPTSTASSSAVYSKQVEDILKRNIFCSKCPPILEVPKAPGEDGPPPPPPLQRTTLNLKVLAIMFAPPPADPHWSIAIIRDNDDKTTGPFSIGSKLRDSTVDDVEEARVILLFADGRREFIDLLDRPVPPPGTPAPAAAAAPADPFAAELEKGIKKIGEHNYEVQRATVDSLLGNMGALAKGARIVPETRDGRPAGFRLFSIRPEGPFAKIGLQNGDVISAINGLEMTSPDKALEVYTKLRTANHLSVAVERGGQKITKDYNIR
jgi:general secretion pathway protein C